MCIQGLDKVEGASGDPQEEYISFAMSPGSLSIRCHLVTWPICLSWWE